MPKPRQKQKKSIELYEDTYFLEDKNKKFQKHFFEEMTYLKSINKDEEILDKLRHTSTEKTIASKIKHKILILILKIMSILRVSSSRSLSPEARKILKQLKDLAVLYELGCVDEEEFIFYKMELGKKYYEILEFAKKVDFNQENSDFYVSKIKEMVDNLEK